MYDLLIKGGRIYDGSGLPSHHGDVAIADGKIVETGRINGSAKRTLTLTGWRWRRVSSIRIRIWTRSCSGTRWALRLVSMA